MSTNVNVLTWNDDQRRISSYVVLGVAAVVALGALAVWYFMSATPAWLYWTLVALLALVLAFMAVLLFVPARTASAVEVVPEAMPETPTGEVAPVAPPAAFEPRVLTLRCGDCGTIFDVTDTGERPLYHTCPGCGAEGALRDEPPPSAGPTEGFAPQAGPELAPETYAPAPAAEEHAPAPAAVAEETPAAPATRTIKLRCGGCKEVFSIEDTGERPLQRACPHCGRMGRIN